MEVSENVKRILKESIKVPDWVQEARNESKTLKALLRGEDYRSELSKIEHIEKSDEKWKAREKYARDIVDLVSRVMRPIDNVYSATGGSKKYDLPESVKADIMNKLTHIRGNKSLEKWLQTYWMPVYHDDPNGVIFLSWKDEEAYPTYKSIADIRNYECDGQKVNWILFEPRKTDINGRIVDLWRLVDDEYDYTFEWNLDDDIKIVEEMTFKNPFEECPALVNSDVSKIGTKVRLSPFNDVISIFREYLRDQSILTIVKFLNGFKQLVRPKIVCPDCHGMHQDGDGCKNDNCQDGFLKDNDVTDVIILPINLDNQDEKVPSASDIAKFVGLDKETWDQYREELKELEPMIFKTVWGSILGNHESTGQKTQLEIWGNTQPVITRLNVYSDTAEYMEWQLSEWVIKFHNQAKKGDVVTISYGRRFIIDPPDALLSRYLEARKENAPITVLDRMLSEYITSKWKSDPEQLFEELVKKSIEPYVHYSVDTVKEIFGVKEAAKKIMFVDWWEELKFEELYQDKKILESKFNEWFNQNYVNDGSKSL